MKLSDHSCPDFVIHQLGAEDVKLCELKKMGVELFFLLGRDVRFEQRGSELATVSELEVVGYSLMVVFR